MSDLTLPQRLRQRAIRHSDILAREAANELDRLNAQALELCAEISGLRRENERLRSDVASMRHDLAVLRGFHHEGCMAEIERLRGALQRIADQYSDKYCGYPEKEADQMARNDLAEIASEALAGAADQPTVCQHDLQLPNDTITSTRWGTAECTVCNEVWKLPSMTPTDPTDGAA